MAVSSGSGFDLFGLSVDIDGDWIVVGAPFGLNGTGAAYVFRIMENGDAFDITQTSRISPDDGMADGWFGLSVAIQENLIWVGAFGAGAMYVFVDNSNDQNGQDWTLYSEFQPSDESDFAAGWSLAYKGTTAVVGSTGDLAYVYESENDIWARTALLVPRSNDSTSYSFGTSVAVARDWILVGAYLDNNVVGENAGAVYVFSKNANGSTTNSWTLVTKLMADKDGSQFDQFGSCVAISEDATTIVVGAFRDDDQGENTGSVYMFRRHADTLGGWTQAGKFSSSNGMIKDQLGISIAISNNIVAASAVNFNYFNGSVYILDTGYVPTPTTPPTVSPTVAPSAAPTQAPTNLLSLNPTYRIMETMVPTVSLPITPSMSMAPTSLQPAIVPIQEGLAPSSTPTSENSSSPTTSKVGNAPQVSPPTGSTPDQDLAKIGIAVGGVAFIVVVIAASFLLYKKWNTQNQPSSANQDLPSEAILDPPAARPSDDVMFIQTLPVVQQDRTIDAIDVLVDGDMEPIVDNDLSHNNLQYLGPQYKDQIQSVVPGTRHVVGARTSAAVMPSTSNNLDPVAPNEQLPMQQRHGGDPPGMATRPFPTLPNGPVNTIQQSKWPST